MTKKKKKPSEIERRADPRLAPGLFNAVSPEFTPSVEQRNLGMPDTNVDDVFDVLPDLKGDRFIE